MKTSLVSFSSKVSLKNVALMKKYSKYVFINWNSDLKYCSRRFISVCISASACLATISGKHNKAEKESLLLKVTMLGHLGVLKMHSFQTLVENSTTINSNRIKTPIFVGNSKIALYISRIRKKSGKKD